MATKRDAKRGESKGNGSACCGEGCCGPGAGCCGMPVAGCCEVEAVVGVDARGQMVLPKELREQAGIKADEKLAIVAWKREGSVCCLSLLKVSELADAVRSAYGPMLSEILRS